MKLKRRESNNGDSYPQSCCHVLPVRRQENDFISSIVGTYFRSSGFCEQDLGVIHLELKDTQEEQEEVEWERKWLLRSNQSSPAPSDITADSYHSCLCPDDTPEGTCSGPCSPGHGAHSTNSLSPSADSPTAVSAAQPAQATGAPPVSAGSDMLQRSFSDDPESWSVEDVILLLKQKDPQISGLLADIFREHDIDGKALLLLKFDVMIRYMGLKLGTALKLCHYIEKLQEEHHLDD
ncbi:sex comb on midleg-like protein 1 [Manis pentadactyla]|uniref:sex comb on midleg-like protein 1 n=1 Tax=Manis pentadactyla TaxID=143292 RepID=UPI00255C771E|nr:sex comb on midleg-like protein 1 [Manis pentadactyla]